MRVPTGGGMIVPGPTRRKIDFDAYGAANAFPRHDCSHCSAYHCSCRFAHSLHSVSIYATPIGSDLTTDIGANQ